MPMPRYNPKRDISEKEIVSTLKQCGFSVYRMDQPVDLLVGFRGVTHLIECKTGKRKFNENQKEFDAEWRGRKVVRLTSAQDAMDWAVMVSSGENV